MNWTAGPPMRPNLSALLRLAVAAAPLFLQKDIQKGVVHPNLSVVVFDEA
jgi:Rad3-related DNA helicase